MYLRAWLVAVVLALHPTNAVAQSYQTAQAAFQKMPAQQRHMVALMLAALGHYNGMATGEFSRRLQQAIAAFQSEIGVAATGILTEQQQDKLMRAGAPVLAGFGLREVAHPFANAKLFVPLKVVESESRTSRGIAYEGNAVAVDFSHYAGSDVSYVDLFQRLSVAGPNRLVAYKVLRDQFFVVAGNYNGRDFYSRFHPTSAGATGFTLSWDPVQLPTGDRLAVLMSNLLAVGLPGTVSQTEQPSSPPPSRPPVAESNRQPSGNSSGTGFFVTTSGMLLTNAHVVESCASIWVTAGTEAPTRARLVRTDRTNDLALVQADMQVATVAQFGRSVRLGEWVGVFGFPLHGLIARSGNFTQGSVSATAGLLDDSRMIQMSAPVQPGNSGGPVLDQFGNVVGVVVSKLNATRVAEISKDIPQNVNFAIKASVATSFLDANGISPRAEDKSRQISVPDVADRAQSIAAYVECRN